MGSIGVSEFDKSIYGMSIITKAQCIGTAFIKPVMENEIQLRKLGKFVFAIKNLCDPKFYDYNKKFNAKAVELLRERQVEVTWSFPAHDIISLITAEFSVTF